MSNEKESKLNLDISDMKTELISVQCSFCYDDNARDEFSKNQTVNIDIKDNNLIVFFSESWINVLNYDVKWRGVICGVDITEDKCKKISINDWEDILAPILNRNSLLLGFLTSQIGSFPLMMSPCLDRSANFKICDICISNK